ncbi:MAG TPA: GntR family transcriptional regulator, partial [Aminivibrio sp.]|nr:GntR family transcriptional regulator [Aminivibrio sp.]
MRKKKKDQAYEEIRKLVLQRRSTDRFSFSENSLAAEMRMSRTPIREALQRLQMEGFIEIHPNRGVVIPEVSVVEVN